MGFNGYLHTDEYPGYQKVEKITRCLCWTHLRRKFVDALPEDIRSPDTIFPSQGLTYCNKLFEIEKYLENLSSEKRKSERLKKKKQVLDAFWTWVNSTKAKILPKSKLGGALNYALNHKLMNYLEDGNCSISNNLAENCIRPFTIGRKNWLFSGSLKGAAASAAVYSLIENKSAKANGLSPYKYLYYIFSQLPGVQLGQHPEFLEDYLPWSPEVQEACK